MAPLTQVTLPLNSASPQIGSILPQAAATPSMPRHSIGIRYLEKAPIRVRGVVSGVCYEFSGSYPVQQVDSRDSPSLLGTRFFRRA
jgi:hypothetical protein